MSDQKQQQQQQQQPEPTEEQKAAGQVYQNAYDQTVSSIKANATAMAPEEADSFGPHLRDKVILITGAGSGFGRDFAKKAASFGAKVVISDINPKTVKVVAEDIATSGGTVAYYPKACDVVDWQSQSDFFKYARDQFKHIDVVVPNAGVTEIAEWTKDEVDNKGNLKKPNYTTLNINLIGASYTARLGLFHLRQNPRKKGKAIVFIGSMASQNGIPMAPMYSIAKHGMLGLFRSMIFNANVEGIAMNIICPWFCATGIIAPLTQVALIGLPLAEVSWVVSAMVRCAADENFTGNTIAVDAEGLLTIPFEATAIGPTGYYMEFAKRASSGITTDKVIRDIGKVFAGLLPKRPIGKLALIGLVYALVRRRIKYGKAP